MNHLPASAPCSSDRCTSHRHEEAISKTRWLSVCPGYPCRHVRAVGKVASSGTLFQMQVCRVKLRNAREFIPGFKHQRLVTKRNQALAAHLLQDTVDVHVRETQRVTEVHLCDRQGAAVAPGQPNRLELQVQFAEKMRDPLKGRASPMLPSIRGRWRCWVRVPIRTLRARELTHAQLRHKRTSTANGRAPSPKGGSETSGWHAFLDS